MSDQEQLLETGRLAELGLQAASLVHELRQPLFAVKAMAQVLAERSDAGDISALSELIVQIEVLEGLIDRYGDAARRPTGAAAPVDVSAAVAAGAEIVRGHRTQIAIDVQSPDTPLWAAVDGIAIQQITSNLVRNAVDAARTYVSVVLTDTALEVRDDGNGISPDIEAKLGQPFVTSKAPGEGTGLGLTVTSTLVEVIGGHLSWTTGPEGTCFRVEFEHG